MAVKGCQAKLRVLMTHVVDVSCDLSVLYSQVLGAHQIEYDRKDDNGGTDDISDVARI